MVAKLAIIGGSGVYDPAIFENIKEHKVSTPYGRPSDAILVGTMKGVEVAFLPRHGKGHIIPPHMINYRANIWALKEMGVERIITPCAVGSLREDYKPGELCIIDQFIDFTKKRDYTFFDGPRTTHVSTADPFCSSLNALLVKEARSLKLPVHEKGTYICIEGPRFSTRAESRMFRNHADVVGMTACPEAQLAREKLMCYSAVAMITDYDVWAEKPVNVDEIIKNVTKNLKNIQSLLKKVIPDIPVKRDCACSNALEGAEL